jgi:hypothetical protein
MWLWVRVGIVILGVAQGFFAHDWPLPRVSVWTLSAVLVFGAVGMLFVVGVQVKNPRSAEVWRYPQWSINPFLLTEPLQFFHLGSFAMIAMGLGMAVRDMAQGAPLGLQHMLLPTFGLSTLIGVFACTRVYHNKMSAPNTSLERTRER